jgi:hypothetical protein
MRVIYYEVIRFIIAEIIILCARVGYIEGAMKLAVTYVEYSIKLARCERRKVL